MPKETWHELVQYLNKMLLWAPYQALPPVREKRHWVPSIPDINKIRKKHILWGIEKLLQGKVFTCKVDGIDYAVAHRSCQWFRYDGPERFPIEK